MNQAVHNIPYNFMLLCGFGMVQAVAGLANGAQRRDCCPMDPLPPSTFVALERGVAITLHATCDGHARCPCD
jgi:hypothetical protein